MTLLVTEADVRVLMASPGAMLEAAQVMERVFVAQAEEHLAMHQRVHLDYPPGSSGERGGRSLRFLPAIVPDLDAAAVRVYTTYKDGDPGRPAPCELILLFSYGTMQLRAIVEDYSLHTLRTAAPTAVATRYLAREDARVAAVLGTGRHARGQLAAVASVRPLESVMVYSPHAERRGAFAEEMTEILGAPVCAVDNPEAAVKDADIVVVAANSEFPVLRGAWLRPGTHVNTIAQGELDDEAVLRAKVFPCFAEEVAAGALDWEPFPRLLREGVLIRADLATELCDVVAGTAPGRTSPEDVTVFVSTGMGIWDVAIAAWAVEAAERAGIGTRLWDDATGRSIPGLAAPLPSLPGMLRGGES